MFTKLKKIKLRYLNNRKRRYMYIQYYLQGKFKVTYISLKGIKILNKDDYYKNTA